MNRVIIFSETISRFIAPRSEPYYFLSSKPRREGDLARIRVGGRDIVVMLCAVKKTVKPSRWLVEIR